MELYILRPCFSIQIPFIFPLQQVLLPNSCDILLGSSTRSSKQLEAGLQRALKLYASMLTVNIDCNECEMLHDQKSPLMNTFVDSEYCFCIKHAKNYLVNDLHTCEEVYSKNAIEKKNKYDCKFMTYLMFDINRLISFNFNLSDIS